ncbi:MAG: right-handed parallel beta-helix repeat-containing protein [Phycisphaerae bacterium]
MTIDRVFSSVCGLVLWASATAVALGPGDALSTSARSSASPSSSASGPIDPAEDPRLAHPLYLDADGDGFGVASPKGPDADEQDPQVNTPESLRQKRGGLKAYLAARGVVARRILYIAPGGDDRKGRDNDEAAPYASWERLHGQVRPGDVVVFRQGTYSGDTAVDCMYPPLRGSQTEPIVLMAYPGERVVLSGTNASLWLGNCANVVFDGFVLDNPNGEGGGQGVWMNECSGITFHNIESMHHQRGLFAMQDLHDILIEDCVIHDNPQMHGIYFGSREKPNSGLTVRRCLIYRNGRHGIQHNGRVQDLRIEDNLIHSNSLGGVALLGGACQSRICRNVIFNNNRQGVVFSLYDDADAGIGSFNQDDNLVEGNIIRVGRGGARGDGQDEADQAAIEFTDDTAGQRQSMAGNIVRNNVLVTDEGPAFQFSHERFAWLTTIVGNRVARQAGPCRILIVVGSAESFGLEAMEGYNKLFSGNTGCQPAETAAVRKLAASPPQPDVAK